MQPQAAAQVIALSLLGLFVSLQGVWLLFRALWPNRVEAAAIRASENPVASLLASLPLTLMMAFVAIHNLRDGGHDEHARQAHHLIAMVLGAIYLLVAGVGMSGLATHVGRRLDSSVSAQSPWQTTLRGGFVLCMAFLFPIIGWFVILPISIFTGFGAAVLGCFTRVAPRPPQYSAMPDPYAAPPIRSPQ